MPNERRNKAVKLAELECKEAVMDYCEYNRRDTMLKQTPDDRAKTSARDAIVRALEHAAEKLKT